jgi:hypothetical protein
MGDGFEPVQALDVRRDTGRTLFVAVRACSGWWAGAGVEPTDLTLIQRVLYAELPARAEECLNFSRRIKGWGDLHAIIPVDRDRGTPHGAAPPTPPGIRVAYHGGSTGLSRWRSIESGETKGIEVVVAQGRLNRRVS